MMRFTVVCIFVILSVIRAEYPANWPKCKNADETCLTKAIQDVIEKYPSGLPEANLLAFDPLRVKSINFDGNPSSAINMNFKLYDSDIIGLKALKLLYVKGYNADLSGRTVINSIIPELVIKGHYKIDGNILILPIAGDGLVEFTIKNVRMLYSFDLKPLEKNGQIYAAVEHVKLDLAPEDGHFKFENLFNGDKELTDNTNAFLNENWRIIYEELKPSITKAVGLLAKSLMNTFFEKHPYAELFI